MFILALKDIQTQKYLYYTNSEKEVDLLSIECILDFYTANKLYIKLSKTSLPNLKMIDIKGLLPELQSHLEGVFNRIIK